MVDVLTNIEDKLKEEEDKGAKELLAEMKRKAEQMKENDVDEREALAKLSEMENAIQSQMAQFNQAVMDGQLSALGSAMSAAQAFEGAGKALMEAKLEKAVQELDKIEEPTLTPKEAKALEEKLKQLAKQAGEVGLGSLSGAIAELGEEVRGGKGGVGKAAKRLGKVVDAVRRRKKVNNLLEDALANVKEAKNNIGMNGGQRVRNPEKSNSPSSNWGRGISGNGLGEKTKLASTRNQVELTGTPGDSGESEVETTTSPEARQQASRAYKDRYQKYRKESDAVLEGEAIPLGQRQLIRKYFESIRPQNGEGVDKPEQK
jgi:DNA repair ATPase RecN